MEKGGEEETLWHEYRGIPGHSAAYRGALRPAKSQRQKF